jgi:hypothetical protein
MKKFGLETWQFIIFVGKTAAHIDKDGFIHGDRPAVGRASREGLHGQALLDFWCG